MEEVRKRIKERGASGILGLGRVFVRQDDDKSGNLDMREFTEAMVEFGLKLHTDTLEELFKAVDLDGSGKINYNEFLESVRPPMPANAEDIVKRAFELMDKSGDGFITQEDLKGVYNVKHHKKFQNGEMTEAQILNEFLATFEKRGDIDGSVTLQEFTDYYRGIWASCTGYPYFELVLVNSFPSLQS